MWLCLPSSRFDSDNVALRKQFQRLLDLIKEGKLHSVSHHT